jgi:hypothetical protein
MSDEIDMSLIGEEFIGSLEYLLDYVFMPSFQGERTLAPFFFWHIDEILNCYFNEDPEWT